MRRSLPALLLLAACSSGPPVLPESGGPLGAGAFGRQAFRCEHGQLLARDADDASDVAGLLADAAADFRERTGRQPSARLLVLAGAGGWGESDEQRFVLGQRGQTALDGQPPLSAAEEAEQTRDFLHEADESHMPPAVMLTLRPAALQPAALVELGLPAEAVAALDWGLVLATSDEVEDAVELLTDTALEHEDIGFGQRLLITPFLPFMRGAVSDAVLAAAKGVIFATHAAAQADWDSARRNSEVQAYLAALTGEIEDRVQAETPHNPVINAP